MKVWNFINFEIYKIYNIFMKFFENFELQKKKLTFFAIWLAAWKWNLVWLDNVETPNRQKTKIDTGSNIPHARCTHCMRGILTVREVYSLHARYTHSEVELRKCCLGQSAKSKIPYHLIKAWIYLTRDVLTAHEVHSLWGRVEKILFRPIRKKRNSLLFNKMIY